jgi:heme o synthase
VSATRPGGRHADGPPSPAAADAEVLAADAATARADTDASPPTDADTDAGDGTEPVGPIHPRGRYESRGGTLDVVRRYVMVTKPRIVELLLVTTVPAMVVAASGWPGTWLVVATVFGGAMSAGSANAFNNFLDRDIDRRMARTSARPTASDEVGPRGAFVLGVVLGVLGFLWLWLLVNLTAALLATWAILYYVFVYTLGLKRRTPQAVVIGGVAGCMPVLTGWAAVTGGSLADPRPWLLFAILFVWQPPHFWALAMKYREDYAAAGLPMLPVVVGNPEATRQILLHSYLLATVVAFTAVAGGFGLVFAVPATLLTVLWLWYAHRLRSTHSVTEAMALFHYSTVYLALVLIAAAVDAALV